MPLFLETVTIVTKRKKKVAARVKIRRSRASARGNCRNRARVSEMVYRHEMRPPLGNGARGRRPHSEDEGRQADLALVREPTGSPIGSRDSDQKYL